MSELTTCPRCGAPLPGGAAPDDCPRCLLAAGLESVAPGAPAGQGAAGADAADGADGTAPRPAPTAPSPEEIAKHFPLLDVLELLGQGGMGIVYKARQKSLDRLVALKVMPPEAAREPGFPERFTREARTLARLQHPNIVQVHDFGVSDGLYYLLMEYVDGANLRQAMRSGGLTPTQALAIVPQVCDALQYAHEHGVVHRDVKPENILLDRAGRVRIADFGLAKIVQRAPVDVTLTRAGQVMGTLQYMAPEQYRTPDAVDHRADIYSLGVVFYEMLTGELPLGSFPPPSAKAGTDLRIDRVVMRALESERERRWQSASDVKTRMTEIAAGADAAGAAPPPPSAAGAAVPAPAQVASGPAPRASRLATVGGLGVPGAMFVGLGIWGAFRLLGDEDGAGAAAGIASSAVVLAGWIASMVAWARIQHAGGALTGRGWAITGTFLPIAFMCCGGPFLMTYGSVRSPMGISVSDGPDGTHVKVPGIDIEDSGNAQRVHIPGIDVETRDGKTRVRISGIVVTDEDRAEAVHVTGGPASLTESDRAALVETVQALWRADGARSLRGISVSGTAPDATAFRFFHLALDDAGTTGRLVVTSDTQAAVVAVARDAEGRWSIESRVEFRDGGAATDADRDGHLLR